MASEIAYYKAALDKIYSETEYRWKDTKSRLCVRLDNIAGLASDALIAFREPRSPNTQPEEE